MLLDRYSRLPKVLTTEAVQASDVVITMGCGDACPFFPGKRYEDWKLDDPAGQGIDRSATRSAPASNSWSANSSERLRLPCTVPGTSSLRRQPPCLVSSASTV